MIDFVYRIILYLIFFFVLHSKILQGDFIGWDALNESYGDMLYGAKALMDGDFPLWNHLERGGYPFIADPQTAILYPPTWLIYLGIFIFGDGIWVALSRSILHYIIGAFGVYQLLKDWGFSKLTYQLLPFLWMSSARFAKSKDSAALWSIVWLPWLIWAVDRLIRKPTLKMSLVVSLCMSFAFLAGYPPNLFRILLLLIPFALILIYQTYQSYALSDQSADAKRYLKTLLALSSLSILTCGCLCLPGILATVDYLPHTVRGALTHQDLFSSRQHVYDLIDLILPRALTPNAYAYLYLGVLPAFLMAYGWLHRKEKKTQINAGISLYLWISFFFFTLLACSQNGLLLPLMMKVLPVFKLWRIPEQYMLIAVFVMLILVAEGLEIFIQDLQLKTKMTLSRLQSYFLVLIPLTLIYGISHFYLYQTKVLKSDLTVVNAFALCGCVIFYFVWTWYAKRSIELGKSINEKTILFVLIFLLGADLLIQNRSVYQLLEKQPSYQKDTELKAINQPIQRIFDHDYFGDRIGARLKINDFHGRFSTMVSAQHQSYLKIAEKYPQLYQIAGIDLLAGKFDQAKLQEVGYQKLKKGKIYLNPKVSPMVYLSNQLDFQSKLKDQDQKTKLATERFFEILGKQGINAQNLPPMIYVDDETLSNLDTTQRSELQELIDHRLTKSMDQTHAIDQSNQLLKIDSKWGHIKIKLKDMKVEDLKAGVVVILETWMPSFKATLHIKEKQYALGHFRVNGLFQGILLGQKMIDEIKAIQRAENPKGLDLQDLWIEMNYQPDLIIKTLYLSALVFIWMLLMFVFKIQRSRLD
jgi:hypothetical protein